jgi:NAD(P)-dependent dehydrogenase (short-subunit alcohol dehydrogenase family)
MNMRSLSVDVTEALWDRIVGTNLKGAFFAAQAACRRAGFVRRRGLSRGAVGAAKGCGKGC